MDYVAEKVVELYRMRDRIHGLEVAWEPPAGSLRFFLMRFAPVGGKLIDSAEEAKNEVTATV
jgi:tryptophanase